MNSLRTTHPQAVLFSKYFSKCLLPLGLLGAALLALPAQAQINATLVPVFTPGTLNSYQYAIQNFGPDAVGEFDLAIPTIYTLTNVTAPSGWLALYTPGDAFISWESTSSASDVPGNVLGGSFLGGFSFLSAAPAGFADYQLLDYNTGDTQSSRVLGPVAFTPPPAPVPEASTTASLSLLLALGGAAVAVKRKKVVRSL